MIEKIKEILKETLISNYDMGNIDDGGISGGDECAKKLHSLIKEIFDELPQMRDSTKNANKHYTCDYEELNGEYQHEWEGINWGWQDCVRKILKIIKKI